MANTEPPPAGAANTLMARPVWRAVLFLALPVLAQQFLILSVSLSDTLLAGRYQAASEEEQVEALGHTLLAVGQLGNSQTPAGSLGSAVAAEAPLAAAEGILSRQAAVLAAQNTAIYISWVLHSYTVLVTVGATALVARLTGAADQPGAARVTNQAVVLGVLLGVAGSAGGLLLVGPLMRALQLQGEASALAADYLRPQLALLTFQVVQAAGVACLAGAGDTRTGFWVLGGVAVINLPLAWALCLGWGPFPELGFVGISLGTALSNVLGCAAVLAVLARGRYGLRLYPALLRPDFGLLRRMLRVSVPAGIDSLSMMAGQLWYLSVVNSLGNVASSAHGVALRWEALGYLSGGAFGTAAMTLVGQSLGANLPARAARSGWVALGLGCGVMSLMGAVFFVLARPMFELFLPHPGQAEIVAEGVPVLRLVAFAMPPLGSAIILTYALRGAGDTRVPVLFTWVGLIGIRIPLVYYLSLDRVDLGPLGSLPGLGMGLLGAWLAMIADLVVRGVFFLARFASGAWQRARV